MAQSFYEGLPDEVVLDQLMLVQPVHQFGDLPDQFFALAGKAQWLLGDRGYDADWFRDAVQAKGIKPCIPERKSGNAPVRHDKRRYIRRNRIEIMFGRLKDWRRVATRYDRLAETYLAAIALVAAVTQWVE